MPAGGAWREKAGAPLAASAFALLIYLPTIGSGPGWQDSGYYLTAVHEMSVLYPHGFILYQFLCKGWTLLIAPVAGFTTAVHLFSAGCAAAAAGFLAAATRLLLRRLDAPRADAAAALTGCWAASCYAIWNSALLAKTYALYFLLLAALLWILLKAERPAHYTAAFALLALAWLAHPTAVLFIPALTALLAARRAVWLPWGAARMAANLLLCAALALLPLLLLPLLAARAHPADMGSPDSPEAWWRHIRGGQFVDDPGAFGWDPVRLAQASTVFWEEYLGLGLILLGLGVWTWVRRRAADAAWMAGMSASLALVALLFRLEGQIDLWLAAAGLPLLPAFGAGLARLGEFRPFLLPLAAGLALSWNLLANARDLDQRGFAAPALWAQAVLGSAEPGSLLVLQVDDSTALAQAAVYVEGRFKDRTVVSGGPAGLPWYDRRLSAMGVVVPEWERAYRGMPGIDLAHFEATAMANANAGPERAVYCETRPDPRHLREDLELVRSGVLWRVAPRGAPAPLPERWLPSEDLRRLGARIGRARGTTLRREGRDLVVTWEPYELKALEALARSRVDLALQRPELAPDALLAALEAFPPLGRETPFLGHLGETLSAAGRLPEGEATFREALAAPEGGLRRSLGAAFLAELAGRRGDYPRARQLKEEALRHAPEDPSIRARLRERLEAVR